MKNPEADQSLASFRLAELNREIGWQEAFDSLRPSPFRPLLYVSATLVAVVLCISALRDWFDADTVVLILLMLVLLQPLLLFDESRKINKRIDALHELLNSRRPPGD